VSGLGGSLHGSVDVAGTLRHPTGRGTLDLRNGAFEVPSIGLIGRNASFALELANDSVIVKQLRLADGDQNRDTASVTGVIRLAGSKWSEWTVNLQSTAHNFRVIDDPRLATAEADWQLAITGALGAPNVSGAVWLPYGVFTIGSQKRARVARGSALTRSRRGVPVVTGVIVSLGNDVRLKSRDANVQLAGDVELFGPLDKPWISGSVYATRGTYRVDLGAIKRTFRVDSGSVLIEGTTDIPAALDIWTSYAVRRADEDDIHVTAHLYGTSDKPRLDLTSDLGSASAQSEIISYLVFGKPSFGVSADRQSTMRTATAALVPTIGGLLEGVLGTVLPFFNTLQVTSLSGEGTQGVIQSPIDGLLNSYAVIGGRQIGSDSFFTVSGGICRASGVSAANSKPYWLGTSAEYRPKRTIGATIAIDPGSSPCSRTGTWRETYQIGLDLSYEWKFGTPKKR
jgi:autotransporter translocation and assembly factor TamB